MAEKIADGYYSSTGHSIHLEVKIEDLPLGNQRDIFHQMLHRHNILGQLSESAQEELDKAFRKAFGSVAS